MEIFMRSVFFIIFSLFITTGWTSCTTNAKEQTNIKQLSENLKQLVLENENRWLLNTSKSMITIIFLEATSPKPRLEHLGLILSDFITSSSDGVKGLDILVTAPSATKEQPFVSTYFENSQRIILQDGKSTIPDSFKKDKKTYNFTFSIGGNNDKTQVNLKLYYTIDKLLGNLEHDLSLVK
jgi:hypothetical protein